MPRPKAPLTTLIVAPMLSLLLAVPGCRETCAVCRDEKCADLVSYCVQDADCACMSSCLGNQGIPGVNGCLSSCGLTERPPAFIPLEECVAVACPDSDECSTPSNYEVPDASTSTDASTDDIGGGDLADCSFDPDLRFDPTGTILQLESADGNVCVRLERLNGGAGSLANTRWILLDIRVGSLGAVSHVDDPADLCWYSSHHNFSDWVHVWTGTRRHDLQLAEDGHDGARTYELHTFEQGPLDGTCAPLADGTGPIDGVVELLPFNP